MASRGFSARRRKDDEVLDVRHLDEAQPAVLVEGDVAPRELHLERHGVVLGAEQHGLLLELRALLAVLEDAFAEPLRLLVLVAAGGEHRAAAVVALGPELLVAALGGLGDERVGGRHDGARGAVVARERAHLGAGKALLEVEDVAHGGGAEAVDGLRVVADAGDAGAVGAQQRDDVRLQGVGVLELVDQHVVEALAHAGAAGRVGEQPAPEQQQVVVVEHLLLLLGVGVAREELRQALLGRQAPGEGGVQHLVQRQLRVDAARVHVEAGGLLREARAAAAEAEGRAGDVHEVLGVAPVEDGEVRLHADVAGVDAQQAGGDGVEGAAPDALGGAAHARAAGRMAPAPPCASTASTRRSISAAARRVKVSSRMRRGSAPRSMRCATRCTSVAVLPVPAPATMSSGPSPCAHGGELLGVELVEHGAVLLGRSARSVAPIGDGCEQMFASATGRVCFGRPLPTVKRWSRTEAVVSR